MGINSKKTLKFKLSPDLEIKQIYNSKKHLKSHSFDDFKIWYQNQDQKCIYCGLSADDSKRIYKNYPEATRGGRRGRRLELDRKIPNKSYGAPLENLVLACYWCNNAKTNYFTYEEFLPVGKIIGEIQHKRLK